MCTKVQITNTIQASPRTSGSKQSSHALVPSLRTLGTLIVMTAITLLPCQADERSDQKFRIGAILPLTGPIRIVGVPLKNAMTLAKEDHDSSNRLEIIFEDDQFIPRNTLTSAQRLLHDRVDAMVVFGTNQGLAVVDSTERTGTPLLSLNVNRSVVEGRKHAVMVMPSLEALTAANIVEARRRGYQRIATVASQQDSCLLQQAILEQAGIGEIVSSHELQPSEREFREVATHIMRSRPDAVFLSTLPPQGSLMAKRLRQLGYQGELFGGIQTAHLAELRASAGALVGGWVVSGDTRSADAFIQVYRKRFGEDPNLLAIYAYEAIRLIIKGMEAKNLNKYLHAIQEVEGIVGRFSADSRNGYTFPVATLECTAEGFQYLKRGE